MWSLIITTKSCYIICKIHSACHQAARLKSLMFQTCDVEKVETLTVQCIQSEVLSVSAQ